MEHLEERRTVLPANDLWAWALAHGGGRHSLPALDAAIAQLRRNGSNSDSVLTRRKLWLVCSMRRRSKCWPRST